MKLIFIANDYKYEIEGVMKLFIPATLFEISYSDKAPGDIDGDFALIEKGDELKVCCRYNGKEKALCSPLCDDEECEYELSRLLYKCMSLLTGKAPEWGIITGIRPVKRVNLLLASGMNDEQIKEHMRSRYLCSDKKTDIALLTAKTQEDILKTLDKKSFGLYISIPFCPTRCSYCSFVSQSIESCKSMIPEYVRQLCEEIEYTAKICKETGIYPDSVYFGGGTPTTLSASQLTAVMQKIAACFDISRVREYTVEAGRPDTITKEKLEAIKANGADRISVNPQSLNDGVLKAIGRKHTVAQFFEALETAKSIGFKCINTDIIAGLPNDTPDSFKNTLDTLIAQDIDSITVHTLSIKRAARLNREGSGEALKNPAGEMVDYATDKLMQSGYLPYYLYRQKNMTDNQENIGWAKKGSESLYNIYIMEEVQTIIALGAGGSTKLVDTDTGRLERVFNFKFPNEYLKGFDEMLRRKSAIGEFYEKK